MRIAYDYAKGDRRQPMTPGTAALVFSIAKGLIKFGGRLDRLLEEKDATTGELVLPMPEVAGGPGGLAMKRQLQELLDSTAGTTPDPIAGQRERLTQVLSGNDPQEIQEMYETLFPEKAFPPEKINPDAAFVKALRAGAPTAALGDDMITAAFFVSKGRDDRKLGFPVRIGLLVVDVLAEFGAENSALLTRNARSQALIQSILVRFAKPNLETFDQWNPLLRFALASTLNGLIDAKSDFQGENPWIDAVLDALAAARETSDGGDDFVLGLLHGKGYQLLLREGLLQASDALATEEVEPFRKIIGEVLSAAAPLAGTSPSFSHFFADHWGDLLRASLNSLQHHGPILLEGQSPLLGKALMAMVSTFEETPNAQLLGNDIVFRLARAAVEAVASKPDLLTGGTTASPWMKSLIQSATTTLANEGIRKTFSRDGLESVLAGALTVLEEYPALIVEHPDLLRDFVGNVLERTITAGRVDAQEIARAIVPAALQAVAGNPKLLSIEYHQVIAGFAEKMAALASDNALGRDGAARLAKAGADAIASNPHLFVTSHETLAASVVDAVLEAARGDDSGILSGSVLFETIEAELFVVSRRGLPLIATNDGVTLLDQLPDLLSAGLQCLKPELGRRLNLRDIPRVLAKLTATWAQGRPSTTSPDDSDFKRTFDEILTTESEASPPSMP